VGIKVGWWSAKLGVWEPRVQHRIGRGVYGRNAITPRGGGLLTHETRV
jgi:hypothetical protein